jgi:hypothetical protein
MKRIDDKQRHTGNGKGWSDVAASTRMLKVANNHQKLGDMKRTNSSSKPPEGTNCANIFILDLGLLNCEGINLLF